MSRIAFLVLAGSLALTTVASASVKDRIFDFTDDYYRANGIDPTKLGGRRQAPSAGAVVDTPNFPFQRNVRVISTFPAYGSNGSTFFFTVNAGFGPDAFTPDAAGRNAKAVAEKFIEYVFPSQGADPVGLGNARQSNLLITNNGYFSKNPLGLWLHVWVGFTPEAFTSKQGIRELAKLRKKNGTAKDGSPIIATESEIKRLKKEGLIKFSYRNDFLRYAVCPTMKDPRDGGIAPDAFLNYTKNEDGSPLEPHFMKAFTSLQTRGDWPRRP